MAVRVAVRTVEHQRRADRAAGNRFLFTNGTRNVDADVDSG